MGDVTERATVPAPPPGYDIGKSAAADIGNPHWVVLVDDAWAVDLAAVGPQFEHAGGGINVEFIAPSGPDALTLRVWERGAGITQACGSGACATLVAAARRKLTGRSATVVLDGGELLIEWLADNHVRMTGAWAESFRGEIELGDLERAVA
jgi:diaminopimelate epimerase